MPARPLSDQTLQLIHALRESLEQELLRINRPELMEERSQFGCYCFFVDGKICMGIKDDELLVRLPPAQHADFLEQLGTRELSPGGGMLGYFWLEPAAYASRAQWNLWIRQALAYNPAAKASPRRKKNESSPNAPSKGLSHKTSETETSATKTADQASKQPSQTGKPGKRGLKSAGKNAGKNNDSSSYISGDNNTDKSAGTAPIKHPIFGSE